MSTISYKCDTCKRDIELLENIYGMTVFSKCVVTEGCKGKLYLNSRNPDSIRETYPSSKPNLNDYIPRRVFFKHEQTNSSTIWKIFHKMSVLPTVTVYEIIDNKFSEIDENFYTISNITPDELNISFSEPKKGIVHLVARSTISNVPNTEEEIFEKVQLSTNGVITFAIPEYINYLDNTILQMNNAEIRVEIKLERPDEEELTCIEELVPNLVPVSPWTTWDKILVRNRRIFLPRTKNVLDFNVFEDSILTLSDIEDGTKITFTKINFDPTSANSNTNKYVDIKSKSLLILLSTAPHSTIDKITDKLLDIGELLNETDNFLSFENGELYVNVSNIEKTYPNISKFENII